MLPKMIYVVTILSHCTKAIDRLLRIRRGYAAYVSCRYIIIPGPKVSVGRAVNPCFS